MFLWMWEAGISMEVIGYSGAGKRVSLVRTHANSLQRPTSGTVEVNGTDLLKFETKMELRDAT